MRKNYTNVAIPEVLAKTIDKYIRKHPLAYRSRAEFVIEAARDLLKRGK